MTARMLVTYERPDDRDTFDEHYDRVHVPLTRRLPGLRRFTVGREVESVRGEASHHLVAELEWDSMAELDAAFASPEGRAAAKDAGHLQTMATMRSVVFTAADVLVPDGPVARVELHRSAPVGASAASVWELVVDWAGMLRWWLPADDGGLRGPTLAGCELIGHHDAVPRTRRMILDSGATVEETLFYQDDDARRVYYRKSPDAEHRGYVASLYVDERGPDASTVHVSSQFDAFGAGTANALVRRYTAVYDAMFLGWQRYLGG